MLITAVLACDISDITGGGAGGGGPSDFDSYYPLTQTQEALAVIAIAAATQTAEAESSQTAQALHIGGVTGSTLTPTPILTPTLTATPTPTLTATPTPTLTFLGQLEEDLWHSDPRGDGLNCVSGAAATVPLPPELDLTGAAAANDPRDPNMIFALSLGAPKAQSGPLEGGVQFYDTTRPLVQDPSWLFNRTGNVSFKFQWNPNTQQMETVAYRVSPAGVWEQFQTNHGAEFVDYQEGSAVVVTIPTNQVPAGSTWFAHVNNNSPVCEQVGLGPDNLPGLSLPDNP